MNLTEIQNTILDARTKGIPGTVRPFPLAEIGARGWNLLAEDLPFPQMVLKRSNLDHNKKVFADYLTRHNLSLAPHGKTTMSPQLYAEQLEAGAWAITAATVPQVQVMRHYGVPRIVLANQLIGKTHLASIAALLNADPGFEFYCFVDSVAQLDNMARHLAETPLAQPIRMLLEVGVTGGRTGVRSTAEGLALADAMAAADPTRFRFAGVAAFEGVVPGAAESLQPVIDYAQSTVDIAAALPPALLQGLDEFILTGGGSSHFDIMAECFATLKLDVPVRILLRSGCYITTDNGGYRSNQEAARNDPHRAWKGELRPALEAWTYVQSRPEPGLALLAMGKRDVPYDAGLPKPLRRYRPGVGFRDVGAAEVFAVNDQHAFVRIEPSSDWQVGDLVASGISHPCTAFDKWRFMPIVSDDYTVIDGILTFF
ncbi:amino acid deaminase [Frigidibacter sp. ROC022]|uniref:amino acid deaminase n=1 Tax=Frigidibacter sp. ROC022 TaxID=2971796 RepID=UPI00215A2B31|nr:amino acid deaminase [Frigidibacter sp. ROC022]MCR8726053.1 amino acid deaminase [Frigidibacter sp. ROC022]